MNNFEAQCSARKTLVVFGGDRFTEEKWNGSWGEREREREKKKKKKTWRGGNWAEGAACSRSFVEECSRSVQPTKSSFAMPISLSSSLHAKGLEVLTCFFLSPKIWKARFWRIWTLFWRGNGDEPVRHPIACFGRTGLNFLY